MKIELSQEREKLINKMIKSLSEEGIDAIYSLGKMEDHFNLNKFGMCSNIEFSQSGAVYSFATSILCRHSGGQAVYKIQGKTENLVEIRPFTDEMYYNNMKSRIIGVLEIKQDKNRLGIK